MQSITPAAPVKQKIYHPVLLKPGKKFAPALESVSVAEEELNGVEFSKGKTTSKLNEYICKVFADSMLEALNAFYGGLYSDFISGPLVRYKYGLAILIRDLWLETKPHKADDSLQALSYNRRTRLIPNGDVSDALRDGALFYTNTDIIDRFAGHCLGVRLWPETIAVIDRVVSECKWSSTNLVDHKGNPYTPEHISRTPYSGSTALDICNLPQYTKLNRKALRAAVAAIEEVFTTGRINRKKHRRLIREIFDKRSEYKYTKEESKRAFIGYLKTVLRQLKYLLTFGAEGIPNEIRMSMSGRLYKPFLQRCHRVVRKVALHGCYCYDFNACHHKIFQHLATKYGILCSRLAEYLLDKTGYRKQLAIELGASPKRVKEALIALAYGAGLRRTVVGKYKKKQSLEESALLQILGDAAFEKAMLTPRFIELANELRMVSDEMLRRAKVRNGKLLNCRLLGMPVTDKQGNDIGKARLKAHLVQGYESVILKSAVSAHSRGTEPGYESVILTLHDGWVTRNVKSIEKAENAVRSGRIKIPVTIDVELYNLVDIDF